MSVEKDRARRICEDLLARTGEGLAIGDFNLFRPCFSLPLEKETFDGAQVLKTEADLKSLFEGVISYFKDVGVTDMVRRCVEAGFHDAETIMGTHESRLMNGAQLIQKPFPVMSTIKLIGSDWLITRSQYAIVDAPRHSAVLGGAPWLSS